MGLAFEQAPSMFCVSRLGKRLVRSHPSKYREHKGKGVKYVNQLWCFAVRHRVMLRVLLVAAVVAATAVALGSPEAVLADPDDWGV